MFEVILSIIYSCKREHLSGVVIWTQQASCLKPQTFRTHFRSVDEKKKMSKRQQSLVRKQRSGQTEALHCFKSTLSARRQQRPRGGGGVGGGPGASAWVSAACWGLRAACQAPSCENRTVCLCSRKKKRAAAQDFAKSACLNFYFCFLTLFLWHGEHTGPCLCAQRDLWPVIVGYTLFCVSVFLFSTPVVLPPHRLWQELTPIIKNALRVSGSRFGGRSKI